MGPSGKQRKAQIQLKRAIKRGDVTRHSTESSPSTRGKKLRRPPTQGHSLQARQVSENASHAARKLQSAFSRLDREILEDTKRLAGVLAVPRPIPHHTRILKEDWIDPQFDGAIDSLCMPKRPKWRFDMSKAEVEGNEQACFRQWLARQDAAIQRWRSEMNTRVIDPVRSSQALEGTASDHEVDMPCLPTYFERNLEVWRQLYVLSLS